MRLLRVTIREGRRITVIELDADSAAQWGYAMINWSDRQADCDASGEAA
ncbi:MAG: hypothetical protein HC900_00660 [Methylacidiphilales bacterium]|nr:hypothetical protein [Candidatus Methylacidiphilales bacterium]